MKHITLFSIWPKLIDQKQISWNKSFYALLLKLHGDSHMETETFLAEAG